ELGWRTEYGVQLNSYAENQPAAEGEALARAIRDGKLDDSAVFAQALTGILDHETFARVLWPTGLFAREHGLGYQAAQLADVPGHPFTLPPCSPPVVCAISQAASTRSGRRHCSLPPTPHAPSSRGATGRPTRSCTGGRDRTGAACCTGGPGNTPTARASDSTWIRPRWADASPT